MSDVLGTYDSRDEAIVAALDELRTPGSTLYVHEQHCKGYESCTCTPQTWTYPEQ